MSLKPLEHLPALIKSKYTSTKAAGALTFAPSELAVLHVGNIAYQLRYCPSLAKKPTPHRERSHAPSQQKSKPDPFDNPDPSLLVTRFSAHNDTHTPPATASKSPATHLLVLNKFPIIPHHFILATAENKPQTHLLEVDDLWATWLCIQQWEQEREDAGRLFAFFNSGEHSGASQAHRHVQFLPVEDMRDGDPGGWDLLVDKLADAPNGLPFQVFTEAITLQIQPSELHATYTRLYNLALDAMRTYASRAPQSLHLHDTSAGDAAISYNLALMGSRMAVCPRRREGVVVAAGRGWEGDVGEAQDGREETVDKAKDGKEVGFVALNGTMLGGTLMVKSREVFEAVKGEGVLRDVLEGVGVPVEGQEKGEEEWRGGMGSAL